MTREEAIQVLQTALTSPFIYGEYADAISMAIEALADRPTGEWWVTKDGETVCSLCGNSVSFSRTEDGWVLGKFCQTCGAKMRGDDSE